MLTAFAILTDGLVYAAYLFVVAIGLTLIFGVMKILNVTHGSFYAFGAFGAASAVGVYFEKGWPVAGGFLLMVLVAMAIGLVLGLIIERGLLRQVYGRDEVIVVLVTFSTFLILEDMILLIWGTRSYPLYQPLAAAGSFDVGALMLSGYDMGLIGLAVALAAGAHWALDIHPLRPPAHGGHLRSRNRSRVRHQRHRGVHRRRSCSAPCWARWAAPPWRRKYRSRSASASR